VEAPRDGHAKPGGKIRRRGKLGNNSQERRAIALEAQISTLRATDIKHSENEKLLQELVVASEQDMHALLSVLQDRLENDNG
jgi:hypothetical protein